MRLVALKFLVGIQVRIRIAQPDDKADAHQIVFHVIEERAAIGLAVERPAGRVDDQPASVFFRHDLPELFEPDAVNLRIAVCIKPVLFAQLPAQLTTATFREKSVLGAQLHAWLVIRTWFAVLADTQVAGSDTGDSIVIVEEHLRGRESRKYFNAQCFSLLRKPPAHIAQTYHVIAVIVKARGQQEVRYLEGATFPQEQKAIFGHRGVQRRVHGLPVREKFRQRARIHHRA